MIQHGYFRGVIFVGKTQPTSTGISSEHESSPAKKHGQWSAKNKKGTCPLLILTTWRYTTESVEYHSCS